MTELLGALGFLAVVFLPGSWVTFGMRLSGLPLWAKLLTASMLSPLVIALEFYAARLLGVSFELSVLLLVFLNLPVLYLIFRQLRRENLPDRVSIAGWALGLLIPLIFFVPLLFYPQARLYIGHSWMHADIVYLIANGELIIEDPELAGVRLAYPWGGHVYQAALSFLLRSPPVSSYLLTNAIWLVAIFIFVGGIVGEFGGNLLSRVSSIVWLSFGVNFLGYLLEQIAPAGFTEAFPIWGDYRYTPWLFSFFFFAQMPLGLGMFSAIAYLMVREWSGGLSREPLVLVTLLLASLGLIYPILFPPALAVVGAKVIALLVDRSSPSQAVPYRQILSLTLALIVAGILTFSHLEFVTQDRVTSAMSLSHALTFIRKTVDGLLATSPLLAGLLLVFPRYWRIRRTSILVLILGALASYVLYVVFRLPHWRNEYKFVFTAAICLAPFPSLALERFLNGLGRKALPVLALLALTLAAPFAHKLWFWFGEVNPPVLDVRGFDLKLDEDEPFSGLSNAIRERTPSDTLLVMAQADLHFPTLTRRALYVPPPSEAPRAGINLTSDHVLANVKGYDKAILDQRRRTVAGLFDGTDSAERGQSLDRILELHRPVAIVIDGERHGALLSWLEEERLGSPVYEGAGSILWLIEPAGA